MKPLVTPLTSLTWIPDLPRHTRTPLGLLLLAACLAAACRGLDEQPATSLAASQSSRAALRAGTGRRELTPLVPVPLAGYGARRGRLLEGRHDPLYARSLVLQSGSLRVAIVSCDLLLIPRDLAEAVARGLPALGIDGLLLAATHTHSGPGAYWDNTLAELSALGSFRPAQFAHIVTAVHGALTEAVAKMEAARIDITSIDAHEYAHNRRIPGGDYDTKLALMHVERLDGSPLAAVVHFAAHPTVLGAGNFLVSADFPGRLCAALEARGYAAALFLNGAAGEAATAWSGPERGFERTRALGEALAARAMEARSDMSPRRLVRLGWRREVVRLPRVSSEGPAAAGWRWVLDPILRLYCPTQTEIATLDIDDWSLLSMPCDLGIGVARRIQQAVPRRNVLCVSYANDYIGYVTDPEAFDRETYEARVSFYGPELASYLEHQACHILTLGR